MHIADGILPVEVSIAAAAVAVGAVYLGGRNPKPEEIPRMGVFAAGLFIVSLIHFPIAGTSVHLGLYGMAGLIFGIRAFPIIFVNLLFQSLVFQHGGLLSVGVNTLTMGSGALAGWLVWKLPVIDRRIKSFFCGFLGILVPAVLVASVFILLSYGRGMAFMLTVYLPTAVIEGLLTVVIYSYFNKAKPGLLGIAPLEEKEKK